MPHQGSLFATPEKSLAKKPEKSVAKLEKGAAKNSAKNPAKNPAKRRANNAAKHPAKNPAVPDNADALAASVAAAPTASAAQPRAHGHAAAGAADARIRPPAPNLVAQYQTAAAPLWLAIGLPELPLLAAARAQLADFVTALARAPVVLASGQGAQQTVWRSNRVAHAAGVRSGMRCGAAATLLPAGERLHVLERDQHAEQRLLQGLAWLALRFSSRVVMSTPDVLLIEAAGSLRLFGGVEGLRAKIEAAFTARLAAVDCDCCVAVAPFPAAAELLVRVGVPQTLHTPQMMLAALAPLPVSALMLRERERADLERLGLAQIGQCLRLPRAGLARRLSPGLLAQLDRLCGRMPDPRPPVCLPERFLSHVELPLPSTDGAHLSRAAASLLELLNDYLDVRCAHVQQLQWRFGARPESERDAGTVVMTQGFAEPGRPGTAQHRRWLEMFVERLQTTTLPGPVEWLELRVPEVMVAPGITHSLIPTAETRAAAREQAWLRLLERLRARLGRGVLWQPEGHADRRPSRAGRYREVLPIDDQKPSAPPTELPGLAQRPLFFCTPETVLPTDAENRPIWGGPLTLLTLRERIESGWWEGEDSSRDYYVARNPNGEQAWVCRVLPRGGSRGYWALQGTFD